MKIIESRASHDLLEYSLKDNDNHAQKKSLLKESSLILLFKSAFLPVGYPQTVSSDYIHYQTYDTLQAFCSSFIGMLSTRSMLRGLGVGNSSSSVLHALLTWTLRDGIHMISRIVFAYIYSYKFSSQLKSWRYAADVFNNIGYALDFTAASFENKLGFTIFASLSVIFKTLTAVAGGSTKTALTNHFAIKGNTADLDAKDGSQETLVNLIGMIIGSYLIQFIPLENLKIWIIFVILGSLHLYFNYLAISAVILRNVNRQRARIIFDHYITTGSIPSPEVVASKESLRFYNDDIYIGESINKLDLQDQAKVIKKFQNQETVMIKDQRIRFIFLVRGLSRDKILKAYLLAVLDQTNQLAKSNILDKFTSELSKSGWVFNIADLDLQGYEYYKASNCIYNVPKKHLWKTLTKSSSNEPAISACPNSVAYSVCNGIAVTSFQEGNGLDYNINAGSVRDLDFCPFVSAKGSHLLAAGTEDSIKIYENESILSDYSVGKAVNNIVFNNIAVNVLLASSDTSLLVYNVDTSSVFNSFDTESEIQSLAWNSQGSQAVTVSKDNIIRLWDLKSSKCQSQGNCHCGIKPSKVVGLKNGTAITTGFSSRREREFCLWDFRDLSRPISTNKIDVSTGIITPLYDTDTDLIFMMGKGDSVIRWAQVEDFKVQEFPTATIGNSITGSCLIPKRTCDVMSGEINRILVISDGGSSLIPISVIVPRKTYTDFHSDIFPDTISEISNTTSLEWEQGILNAPGLISLDPRKIGQPTNDLEKVAIKEDDTVPKKTNEALNGNADQSSLADSKSIKPVAKNIALPKSSMYRFVEGKLDVQFKDITNLNPNITNESNGFKANKDIMAFSLTGAGGRIGIWFTKDVGRVPVRIPSVICGSEVCDFKFDPFNNYRLATATEDGKIRLWTFPSTKMQQDITSPDETINAHSSRCSLLQFHHLASDILLSGSPEIGASVIKIWNLNDKSVILELAHPDNILSATFSFDGYSIGSVCRDRTVRVFNKNGLLGQSWEGHEGLKASRIFWLGNTGRICTFGFGRANSRELRVYNLENLSESCCSLNIGTSPSLVSPYYDKDTGLIALAGRGDSYVSFYEITEDGKPRFTSRYDCPPQHQSIQFLPKRLCDVAGVEIMSGYRVTSSTIDKVSFKVPRLHKDHFQDDIFCPTIDTESPYLSAKDWINGKSPSLKLIDLRPSGMPLLSERVPVQTEKKAIIFEIERTEQDKKDDAIKSMIEQASKLDTKLEQDEMEGCEEEEWD